MIRPLSNPLKSTGGLVIMRGNLAPEGCVIKVTGIERKQQRGPARVFECEEDAMNAVTSGKIRSGDIMVIRYEGPRGGPGMREMLGVTSAIVGAGLSEEVALITDGRFSGATCADSRSGTSLPRPLNGGPIAVVHEGDTISLDIETRKIELELDPAELDARSRAWKAPELKYTTGVFQKYVKLVGSAAQGAVTC